MIVCDSTYVSTIHFSDSIAGCDCFLLKNCIEQILLQRISKIVGDINCKIPNAAESDGNRPGRVSKCIAPGCLQQNMPAL